MKSNTSVDLLLIHPPHHRRRGSGVVFPLGLGYLAAVASNAGFKVSIIDCALSFSSLDSESLQKLRSWLTHQLRHLPPPLAIGIGPCTTPVVRALKIIAEICGSLYPETPLVYGGPLASIPGQEFIFFVTVHRAIDASDFFHCEKHVCVFWNKF